MKGNIKQRYLSYLGLFAVFMLFFGPLTTQIIAMGVYTSSKTQVHQHHQQIASQTTSVHHNHDSAAAEINKNTPPPSHHNMSACGYCDLVHSPMLFTYTPIIANAPPRFKQHLAYHTEIVFLALYNTPLSRAPPFIS